MKKKITCSKWLNHHSLRESKCKAPMWASGSRVSRAAEDLWRTSPTGTAIQETMDYHHRLTPTNATPTLVLRGILVQNVRALNSSAAFDTQGLEESLIHNLTLAHVLVDTPRPPVSRSYSIAWIRSAPGVAASGNRGCF